MIKTITHYTLIILCFGCALMACENTHSDSKSENNVSNETNTQFKSLKMFPQGKSFSGFQLSNQNGDAWHSSDFKGNYSVLFFGFTHCPDICPTTLLDMQKVDKKLKLQNIKSPDFTFVSVDSDRDTPEVMKEYIEFFNPEFNALSGDAANILSLASQLGVAYKVEEHQTGDLIYDVDHASALFVLNPEGERIGLFTAPHDVEVITDDLIKLMEAS